MISKGDEHILLTNGCKLDRADKKTVEDYWKWVCDLPKRANPAIHNDGDRTIAANKSNPRGDEYIFLTPAISGAFHRELGTIQRGKKLLITSLSFIGCEAERPGSDVSQLYKFADVDHDNIEYRRIEIDGRPLVGDLENRFRVRTDPFEVKFPEKAIFGARKGPSKAVADGIYIVWEPGVGKHEIHVEGKIDLPDEEEDSLDTSPFTEFYTYTFGVQ